MPSKMKDSGIEWIGEIPEGWEVKKFKFLFSFNKGLTITREDLRDKGIPCVNYGEIHSKYGFEVNPEKNELKCVDKEYLVNSSDSLLKYGDFVFADTSEDLEGSGNFTYLNSHADTFAGYHTIIAKAKAKLNTRFIAYYFDSVGFRSQIRYKVSGIKVFSISQSILKEAQIIFPSSTEQEKIIKFLDPKCSAINKSIELLNSSIEKLQEYKKSVITEAVTKGLNSNVPMKDSGIEWIGEIPEEWKAIKIKYLCSMQSGENLTSEEINDSGEYLVYGGNGYRGYYASYNVNRDVLLVGRQGALCGNVHKISGKLWATEHAVITKNYTNCNINYLLYLLTSMNLNQYSTSAAQPGLAVSAIQKLSACIPPKLPEQQAIAFYLDKKCSVIDKTIVEKQDLIGKLSEYKKSLICEVVTGKREVIYEYK